MDSSISMHRWKTKRETSVAFMTSILWQDLISRCLWWAALAVSFSAWLRMKLRNRTGCRHDVVCSSSSSVCGKLDIQRDNVDHIFVKLSPSWSLLWSWALLNEWGRGCRQVLIDTVTFLFYKRLGLFMVTALSCKLVLCKEYCLLLFTSDALQKQYK